MEFINATALWGLLLAAVPIVIHLITRRRALKKPFAAIRFVLLSHRNLKRRLRLKRILILLARISAVIALAFMVSHPTLPARGGAMSIGETPRSLVIVLDNSAGMLAEINGHKPWDAARLPAMSIVDSIAAGHEAALILTNPNGKAIPAFSAKPGDLKKILENVEPSYTYRPITDSIVEAVGLLETARHELRQILLITDLQRSAWLGNIAIADANARIAVLDVGGVDPYPGNAAVAAVELEPSAGQARYTAVVEVAGFSKGPVVGKEIAVIANDENRARGFFDLPERGVIVKKLNFSASGKGILRGVAHLSPDNLKIDNDRFFTARAGGRIKALVVDGDPKAQRYGSESYYLMNALNPKLEARSRIDPVLITAGGLKKAEFGEFDVVIMANVGEIGVKVLERLKKYVSNGGALLISLGDKIDPGSFDTTYSDLAPAGLYILKELPTPAKINPTGTNHPAIEIFRTPAGGDISLAEFSKYFMPDISAGEENGAKTVLELDDGAPILVEKAYGRGRVAMWTSSLDRDWNDFCIYPTYLPILQQLSLYLTGGMADPVGSGFMIGETAKFSCPSDSKSAWVIDPDGGSTRVELLKEDSLKEGSVKLDRGTGFYEVFCSKSEKLNRGSEIEPDRLLAANIDIRESDLERWKPEALENHLKKAGFRDVKVVADTAKLAEAEGFKSGRRDVFKYALAVLMAMLLMEGALTRRG